MKRFPTGLLLTLAILAGGAAGYWFVYLPFLAPQTSQASPTPAGAGAPAAGAPQGLPVEVATVKTENLIRTVTAVGSVLSNESVVIRPEIAGRVVRINFQEGARVEKGRVLFELDSAAQRAEIEQTRANRELSQKNLERADELLHKGAGTQRAKDEALASHRVNEATLVYKTTMLDKTAIRAPFDGIVGLRKVSVGDYVSPGQDMVNLESVDPVKLDFQVPEAALRVAAEGQRVAVRVDAFPEHIFEGTVFAINPRLDADTRSVAVRARVPNPEGRLRPGLFARVVLDVETRPDAMLIPEQAVIPVGADRFVFTVVDGKAAQTKVTLGLRRTGEVEVTGGLAPGATVVTAGHQKLRPGMPVTVVSGAKGA